MRSALGLRRILGAAVFAGSVILALSAPFMVTLLRYDAGAPHATVAVSGAIDLRGWDFASDGPVPLVGEWSFSPGDLTDASLVAFRTVPDLWKGDDAGGVSGRGYGTYRLRVVADVGASGLALRWTTVSTSFSLSVDNERIAGAGEPAAVKNDARAAYSPGIATLPPEVFADGEAILTVRVSNHEYRSGGMWRPFVLGAEHELRMAKRNLDFLTLVTIGILIGLAAQHFFLFVFRRNSIVSLYFFLFTASISLRSLVTGEYLLTRILPDIPFEALIRLEYVSAYFPLPIAVLFFSRVFGRKPQRVIMGLLVVFLPLIPFAPLPLLTRSILIYNPLALVTVLFLLASLAWAAIKNENEGARTIFIGGIVVASATVNDLLFNAFIVRTGNLLPSALLVLTVIMAAVLARRYTTAFTQIEGLLAEKETHLREMHHRVKNSLQIVASVAGMQVKRVSEKKTADLFRAMRERIRSVALVHEKLHASLDGDRVDLADYAKDLIAQIAASHGPDDASASSASSGEPRVEVAADLGSAPIEYCVDIGLVLTELIVNAYKHAGGVRSVSMEREADRLKIAILDAGPGFMLATVVESDASLGYKIVSSVLQRYGGSIKVRTNGGSVVELELRLPDSEKKG